MKFIVLTSLNILKWQFQWKIIITHHIFHVQIQIASFHTLIYNKNYFDGKNVGLIV